MGIINCFHVSLPLLGLKTKQQQADPLTDTLSDRDLKTLTRMTLNTSWSLCLFWIMMETPPCWSSRKT